MTLTSRASPACCLTAFSPQLLYLAKFAADRANLGVIRAASLRTGVNFWNFFKAVQVGDADSDPTEAQLRWQGACTGPY